MRSIGFNIDHSGLNYDQILSLSQLAEDAGFDNLAFYDHFYDPTGGTQNKRLSLEAWSLLSAISLKTQRIKLLPLVTNNLFRHPGILAKIAATVDHLSKGRLIFGIGAGWFEKEALDFGYAFPDLDTRLEMLDEALSVITSLWTQEATTFQGKYYKLDKAQSLPKPYQKPFTPVLVGGKTNGILKIAAKHAQLTNFTIRNLGVEECAKKIELLKKYCSEQGRDYESLSKTLSGLCFFASSQKELETELVEAAKFRGTSKEELERTLKSSAVYGTNEQVLEELERYEKIGIQGAMFRFYKPLQGEKARTFSKEILPQIRR